MNDNKEFVTFSIAENIYAIELVQVHAIARVKPEEIRSLPNTNSDVLGITTIQDDVIPILDLRIKFETPSHVENPYTLVCQVEDITLGLVVDTVHDVVPLDDSSKIGNFDGISLGVASRFLRSIHRDSKKEDTYIIVLDAQKILNENELDDIKEKTKKD